MRGAGYGPPSRVRRLLAIVTPVVGLLFVTWWQTCVSTAALVTLPACSSVDAEPFGQITGVEVLGDTLTAGRGCGQKNTEIFKYVTLVSIPQEHLTGGDWDAGHYIIGSITDCFANATFQTLCTYPDDGGTGANYDLSVYAFNETQWNASGMAATSRVAAQNLLESNAEASNKANTSTCQTTPMPAITGATWTTTCSAVEQSTVPVLATCGVLEVPEGGVAPSDDAGASDASADDADAATAAGMSDAGAG
jgi:hypothetical protein